MTRAIETWTWMLRRTGGLRIAILACCLGVGGCACEKGPCRATRRPQRATGISQGVVGVVAYETDDCEGSCCECSWSQAELMLWTTPEALADRDAVIARVSHGAPSERFSVDGHYEHALAPGHYLLCDMFACASLSIDRDEVVTVNYQQVYGPTILRVFVGSKARPELAFDVENALLDNPEAGVDP